LDVRKHKDVIADHILSIFCDELIGMDSLGFQPVSDLPDELVILLCRPQSILIH
jgi:hypothetical protein